MEPPEITDSSRGAPQSRREPIFPDMDIFCPHCQYNLRGLTEPRCPECGRAFDPRALLMLPPVDPSESVSAPAGSAIFDFDIPCPHCEYNLRGLVEARCPECGRPFEPHAVLMAYRDNQPPLPILRVMRNMYRHPLGFWRLPEVKRSRGPRRLQIFFALIYVPIVITMFCALLVSGLLRAGRPVAFEIVFIVLMTPIQGVFMSLAVYMFCLIHAILCRAALAISRKREGVRAAKEIVGYGLVWLAPVLVAVVMVGPTIGALLVPGTGPWVRGQAILALGAGAAACIAWAVTLYEGGKFASGGNRLVGAWCVLSNPFFYILGFVLAMVILR